MSLHRSLFLARCPAAATDGVSASSQKCLISSSHRFPGLPLGLLLNKVQLIRAVLQHNHYFYFDCSCFISPGLAMYLGLLTPIALILLHNVITFILVMRSLLKVKEASRSEQITKRLQNAVGISALMGLTWCFGFLAIEGATFAFQLLFCLFNSLQVCSLYS